MIIRNIKFSNLHTEKNTIELTMRKTGKEITLPLIENISMAIIVYLKYGRSHTDLDIIFSAYNSLSGDTMRLIMVSFCSCEYRTPFFPVISINLRVIHLTITL